MHICIVAFYIIIFIKLHIYTSSHKKIIKIIIIIKSIINNNNIYYYEEVVLCFQIYMERRSFNVSSRTGRIMIIMEDENNDTV